MKTFTISFLLASFFIVSCKSKEKKEIETTAEEVLDTVQQNDPEEDLVIETAPPDDYFYEKDGFVKAVVIDYSKLDGCTWMIKTMDNELLRPMKLDSSFHRNKFPVWVKFKPTKPLVNVCMAGKSVYITEIEPRN